MEARGGAHLEISLPDGRGLEPLKDSECIVILCPSMLSEAPRVAAMGAAQEQTHRRCSHCSYKYDFANKVPVTMYGLLMRHHCPGLCVHYQHAWCSHSILLTTMLGRYTYVLFYKMKKLRLREINLSDDSQLLSISKSEILSRSVYWTQQKRKL